MRGGEDLLAIERDDELVRRLLPFDADVAFGDGPQQAAGEDVLTVGREVVLDAEAAARAERQSVDVLASA